MSLPRCGLLNTLLPVPLPAHISHSVLCSQIGSVPAGGIFIRRSNYSLDGVMFTANAAGLGGGLFVAANLSSNVSMRNLVFANDDRAIRGVKPS